MSEPEARPLAAEVANILQRGFARARARGGPLVIERWGGGPTLSLTYRGDDPDVGTSIWGGWLGDHRVLVLHGSDAIEVYVDGRCSFRFEGRDLDG